MWRDHPVRTECFCCGGCGCHTKTLTALERLTAILLLGPQSSLYSQGHAQSMQFLADIRNMATIIYLIPHILFVPHKIKRLWQGLAKEMVPLAVEMSRSLALVAYQANWR